MEMEKFDAKLRDVTEARRSFYVHLDGVLGKELSELNSAGKWSDECYVGPRSDEKMMELAKVSKQEKKIHTDLEQNNNIDQH